VDSTVYFDVDADGYKEQTAWAGPADGLLVIDLAANGAPGADGKIDQAMEIAFARWTAAADTDLEALASVFDSNHNNAFDGSDARWGEFRIWKDANQDGVTDAGELSTLTALGIAYISLVSDHHALMLSDGSRIDGFAGFTRTNGSTGTLADVGLAFDPDGFKRIALSGLEFAYVTEDGTVKYTAVGTNEDEQTYTINPPGNPNAPPTDAFIGGNHRDYIDARGLHPVTLYGGADDDEIFGGAGNDVISGGPGEDLLVGREGNDTIYFDIFDFRIYHYAERPEFTGRYMVLGEAGYDTGIYTSANAITINLTELGLESLISNQGDDSITANIFAGNYIDGRGGNDTIVGSAYDDVLVGGTGNDLINGGGGVDLIMGGAGNDTLNGQDGDDAIFGGDGDDIVNGNNNNDTLHGGAGNDALAGNAGDDSLDGEAGTDTMTGGAGNDTYYIDSEADAVIENADEGSDTVFAAVNCTLPANVESLSLLEGAAAAVNAAGNGVQNFLTGNSLNNSLYGLGGGDVLTGGGGNDTIDGGTGNDAMWGGTGNDTYYVDTQADAIFENANEGNDTVFTTIDYTLAANFETLFLVEGAAGAINAAGNGVQNFIYGNSLANTLSGFGGDDVLVGGAGNDTIDGGAGNDAMWGGTGNDTYVVDSQSDSVVENPNEGTDTVTASVDCTLAGNVENLTLLAGAVNGVGNGTANTLAGNSANNTLDGRGGADVLVGNGGNDTFRFQSGEANGDAIADFDGAGAAAGDSLSFVGYGSAAQGAAFTQVGASAQWKIHSGLDGHDEFITLQNAAAVHASDYAFA
jgi:Ca2+-binding RTX toxin-like protein